MRLLFLAFLYLASLGVANDVVWSGEKASAAKPSDTIIISMAQQFVLEHFTRQPERHFGIAFDIANIHPQPDPGYFAVVGGFMADSGGKQYKPHAFGIAIRLICAEHDEQKCWQMEKLVIDQKIILNN